MSKKYRTKINSADFLKKNFFAIQSRLIAFYDFNSEVHNLSNSKFAVNKISALAEEASTVNIKAIRSGKRMKKLSIPCSLNRFIYKAVAQVSRYIRRRYSYVVGLGLEKFFDRVSHDRFMSRLAKRSEAVNSE